jgi:hypothetical protein
MFEVYFFDRQAGRFTVHAAFAHRGAAEAVAVRLTARSGSPHFVRLKPA